MPAATEILKDEVVFIGIGVHTPLGNSKKSLIENLMAGRSGIRDIENFLGYKLNPVVKYAGFIEGFDPKNYLTHGEIRRSHRSSQLACADVIEASMDAGILKRFPEPGKKRDNRDLFIDQVDPRRIEIIAGTGAGGSPYTAVIEDVELMRAADDLSRELDSKRDEQKYEGLPSNIHKLVLEEIIKRAGRRESNRTIYNLLIILNERSASLPGLVLGTKGGYHATVAACGSSTQALISAYKTLKTDSYKDIVIVVGTDSLLDPISILSFQVLGALTTTEHTDPGEASRPLDEKADGFVMSEASTAFVMARRSFAERIGARILGTLSGFGCSSDAFHDTAPDPSASGVIQSMSQALEMSGKIIIKEDNFEVSPEKFKDLVISTHTTSTGDADAIEVDGIKRVLGEVTPSTPIVGLKDRLGHGLGASGSVEIAACLLMMQQNCIPGMPNLKNPRRLLSDFDFVTSSRKGVKVDSILKNSVAFGGGCYSVCIEKEKE